MKFLLCLLGNHDLHIWPDYHTIPDMLNEPWIRYDCERCGKVVWLRRSEANPLDIYEKKLEAKKLTK